MFKLIRNNKAQATVGEYVLVFFVVVGVITGMSIFVRRAIQGRIRDAQDTMYRTIEGEVTNTFGLGNGLRFRREYEPYYALRWAQTQHTQNERRQLYGSFNQSSGIYRLDIDKDETRVTSNGYQLPPVFGN